MGSFSSAGATLANPQLFLSSFWTIPHDFEEWHADFAYREFFCFRAR
jgi:hypothetical protein